MEHKAFRASIRPIDGVIAIDLAGDIDGAAEEALNRAYAQAENANSDPVLLNFSSVGYINSTGIALVVGLLARARKSHRKLVTYGLSDHYQEIFRITRLSDFMGMYDDEASALQGMGD
ncbi:MAG: anti-sigma factor antagonist [Chloroflexi bacterium]|nr:MAG: anti-sigma factor antagonist [Chloroflexota bacterium]